MIELECHWGNYLLALKSVSERLLLDYIKYKIS